MPDARELRFSREQPIVAAALGARTDIAEVHHEGEGLGVDLVDQPVKPLDLRFAVRRVAQNAEGALARRQRRERRATRDQQEN